MLNLLLTKYWKLFLMNNFIVNRENKNMPMSGGEFYLSNEFFLKKNSNLYKSLVETNEEHIKNFMQAGNDDEMSECFEERRAALFKCIMKQYKHNSIKT